MRAVVDEAVAHAQSAPEPPLEEAFTDVFRDTPPDEIRGCDPFTTIHPKS